jgi:hypothetical protein
MRKTILVALIFVAQCTQAQKAQRILSFVIDKHESEWYVEQAKLWKAEIDKNNGNAYAWFNYYRATRNAFRTEQKETLSSDEKRDALDGICAEAKQAVPESFEYNLMMYMQYPNNPDYLKYYVKAEQLGPDREEIYCEAVTQAEVERKIDKRDKYSLLWLNSNMSSPGVLRYHTNLLNSLDKNAILFTQGDMDTYPLWMLQAKGLRRDVTVINTSLMLLENYRNKLCIELGIDETQIKFDEKDTEPAKTLITHFAKASKTTPVYIGLTCSEDLRNSMKDKLELVGLAYQHKKSSMDAFAICKKNVEEVFALDYLENNFGYDISKDAADCFNQNYLPTFVALYQHYKTKGDGKKMQWYKHKIEVLAEGRADQAEIMKGLSN